MCVRACMSVCVCVCVCMYVIECLSYSATVQYFSSFTLCALCVGVCFVVWIVCVRVFVRVRVLI